MASESPARLHDEESRLRAATDFGTNLVVLAGAGTGKTSLLVERALNALGSGVVTIDSLAAITFTEKAAGEMRERLALGLDRLRALAKGEGKAQDAEREADRAFRHLTEVVGVGRPEIAERSLAATEQLDFGTVVTIHGFCAELLRAHPIEAGVDPGFVVDGGEWAETLGRDAWDEFVLRELGRDGQRADAWEPVLSTIPLSGIGQVARRLAGFGVPAELLRGTDPAAPREALGAEARRIADDLDALLRRPDVLTGVGAQCFRWMADAMEALIRGGVERCREAVVANEELAKRIGSGNLGSARTSAGAAAGERFKRVRQEARSFLKRILETDDRTIGRLVEVVRPFADAFRERYLRRGLVSFDGLLALTRDMLRDCPRLRRELKTRYGLLLVDEFQDTDPLQYEIVLFLAEQVDEEANEAYRADLAPGKLFVVGDAKQSIYRFRGADYAAYQRAIERIVAAGGVKLDLVTNFRSVPGIVAPINKLFDEPGGSWIASAQQPEYVSIHPAREPRDGRPAVDVWTIDPGDRARADDRREAEGRVIAEAIERWVEREKCRAYRDITILFRAFSNVSHYLRPLRERGIPFVVDGGRDFLKRPEVSQLMAALRALANPADQPSLLAFLRSPAGGVRDVELADFARERGRWSWWSRPDPGRFPAISRSFSLLRSLKESTDGLPVDCQVRVVLDRTPMLPLSAAAHEGPQRVANLRKLCAAAGELARDGSLSLDEVLEALEEGRLEDIQTDRPLADDAAEAVRITSIHRMKGLENDVIVLPDLARKTGSGEVAPDPVSVARLRDGTVSLAIKAGGLRNSAHVWHELDDGRHEDSEEVRVLYVALTRARERLILVASKTRGTTPWIDALRPWGYDVRTPPGDGDVLEAGHVRHRRRTPPERRLPPEQEVPEEATRAVVAYESAMRAFAEAAKPPLAAPSGLAEERRARWEARGDWLPRGVRPSRAPAKAAGIVLHRMLEGWDGSDRDTLASRLDPVCDETARETRADRAELARDAREILDAFLRSPLADRLGRIERLGAEVPLLLHRPDEATTFRGSIDLLYRDGDDVVVADFKTDREEDVDELRRMYAEQVALYAEAVHRALRLARRPRAELWMLRTGRVVVVDDRPAEPPGSGDVPQQLRLW